VSKKAASGKRRAAREMAVRMLYQHDLGGSPAQQVFANFDVTEYLAESRTGDGGPAAKPGAVEEAFAHAQRLVEGTLAHQEQIDELIRRQAAHWRLERMPPVDRNILRLAVYEMLHEADVPKLVVLDEAIELAKRYGSENSGRFVNGLLDGLLKGKAVPGGVP
jgi:N utilization substance protein B